MDRSRAFVVVLCLCVMAFSIAPDWAVSELLAHDGKSPVPDAAARDIALKLLRDHYKSDYADTSVEGRLALASTLKAMAVDLSDDPINRYVLLDQARALSIQAGHVQHALDAIDKLSEWYDIDIRTVRVETVLQLIAKPESDPTAVANAAFALADEAMTRGDDAEANKFTNAIAQKLRTSEDESLQERLRKLRSNVNLRLKVKALKSQLAKQPNNPNANLELGSYYCFVLGDFEHGFPMLAKGSDPNLAELARIEMDKPASPEAQFDLAEKWLKYLDSARPEVHAQVLLRTATWYRMAEPRLSGLKKQLAADRLKKLSATPATPANGVAEIPSGKAVNDAPSALPAKYAKRKNAGNDPVVRAALEWLRAHQNPQGYWSSDSFSLQCEGNRCDGDGDAQCSVGVTGLALLAFLGAGNSPSVGPHKDVVRAATNYLSEIQDKDTGCFGSVGSHTTFLYDHAIATYALAETLGMSGTDAMREATQKGVHFIQSARNPYKAWRYEYPPEGRNDTSITGWMVCALQSARSSGIVVDDEAFVGARLWIDDVTDEKTWRTGYMSRGQGVGREAGTAERWPENRSESPTATAMMCRVLTGDDVDTSPALRGGADLLRKQLPNWDTGEGTIDYYYWYYGTSAMWMMGGEDWARWQPKIDTILREQQERSGCEKGSWAPQWDPWGLRGGRVYSTAILCLCAEAPYRLER